MKKLFSCIFFLIFLINPAYSKVGKGNLTLSPNVLDYLIEYLRNEYGASFVVSGDGKNAFYGICGVKTCSGGTGHTLTLLKECKKNSGAQCYIFAQRKNMSKVIRWNKVDYVFPKGNWNYNASVKSKYLKGHNKGLNESVSNDKIKAILANLGFINQTPSLAAIDTNISIIEETNNDNRKYFCIMVAENQDYKYFAESKQYKKYWKKDCKKYSLYIVYKDKHSKLYKSLVWKYKNITSLDPGKRLNEKTFLLIENNIPMVQKVKKQIPKNVIEQKEEVEQSIVTNETSVVPKVEKKITKQQQNEIDQIKEMFDIGALTKEEYDTAIKRVLN